MAEGGAGLKVGAEVIMEREMKRDQNNHRREMKMNLKLRKVKYAFKKAPPNISFTQSTIV